MQESESYLATFSPDVWDKLPIMEKKAERDHNMQTMVEEEYGDENGQTEDGRDEVVEVVNENEAERDQNMKIMMDVEYEDENWQMEDTDEIVMVVNGDENEQIEDEAERDQNMWTMVKVANADANDQQVEEETKRDQNRQSQTKLCVAISKALGRDRLDLILTLDGIRHKLKHEYQTEETISQHRHYICKIKKDLKKKESDLKLQIKSFENSFYLTHSRLPDEDIEDYRSSNCGKWIRSDAEALGKSETSYVFMQYNYTMRVTCDSYTMKIQGILGVWQCSAWTLTVILLPVSVGRVSSFLAPTSKQTPQV